MCLCHTCRYLHYIGDETYICNIRDYTNNYFFFNDIESCDFYRNYIRKSIEQTISELEKLFNKYNFKHYLEYDNLSAYYTLYSDNIDFEYFVNQMENIIKDNNIDDFILYIKNNDKKIIKYF